MRLISKLLQLYIGILFILNPVHASKLHKVNVIDKDYVMLHFIDAEVAFVDDGIGDLAYMHHTHDSTNNYIINYGAELNINEVQQVNSFSIFSSNDSNYANNIKPEVIYRKTKVNGQLEKGYNYNKNDFEYDYTFEHYIYLKLPFSLKQGCNYSISINPKLNSNSNKATFAYNNFENVSEAIHLNLVGFSTKKSAKSADVYMWMGDGGSRNYTSFQGNKAYLLDTKTNEKHSIGKLEFYRKQSADVKGYRLIASDIWKADFSKFSTPGTYRLVVEGIGCSHTFEINPLVYYDPFRVSLLGYTYMRIGQDSSGMHPIPRRPLYIPEKSPANTKVYVTNLHPYSELWGSTGADTWDKPDFFRQHIKKGMPVNNNVKGGHSDALDWDRHLGHVSIIYDMLLPYILSGGALNDDNTGIPESGNNIPDLIDEARNEVDFFLSMRYKGGYGHGISNPMFHNFHDTEGEIDSAWVNVLFQADNTPIAAWANAANAAMLSYAFKLAGNSSLMQVYLDSALNAYSYANGLDDKMLDGIQDIGESKMRGRDFKMTAAAYLYNLTGESNFEEIIFTETEVKTDTSEIVNKNKFNQLWATVGYLLTDQEIRYADLHSQMKKSIIYQARKKEANYINIRPSGRATDDETGYFKTIQNVQRCIVAHSITANYTEKQFFEKALIHEADWGLGRNPLNIIEMTTATTVLENKRSMENIFTSGRDDGTPGLHPGHTPYLNMENWSKSRIEGMPGVIAQKCYPKFEQWSQSEGYFNTRYMFAHSEFTPQQTMRGKMALYAYLYYLGKQENINKM